MITLKDFLDCTDYGITESSKFLWDCYGDNALSVEYWDGRCDEAGSASIVIDIKTGTVYQMEVWDHTNLREYRWINPEYFEVYRTESERRDLDYRNSADDREYIDLEDIEDMLEKTYNILHEIEYDSRVSVPLNLSEEEEIRLMRLAHEKDMSLNQLVEEILRAEIDKARVWE